MYYQNEAKYFIHIRYFMGQTSWLEAQSAIKNLLQAFDPTQAGLYESYRLDILYSSTCICMLLDV